MIDMDLNGDKKVDPWERLCMLILLAAVGTLTATHLL